MAGILFLVFIVGACIKNHALGGVLLVIAALSLFGVIVAFISLFDNEGAAPNKNKASNQQYKQYVIYMSIASLLAKMAKADGRIDKTEISSAANSFEKICGSRNSMAYSFCINVFRAAKNDFYPIDYYAKVIAYNLADLDARMLVYEFLWDMAIADGILAESEREILYSIVKHLDVPKICYSNFFGAWKNANTQDSNRNLEQIHKAYNILQATDGMTNDELKQQYRNLARRHHPDVLRANGLSDDMIKWATEKMSQINSAWEILCKHRGMS